MEPMARGSTLRPDRLTPRDEGGIRIAKRVREIGAGAGLDDLLRGSGGRHAVRHGIARLGAETLEGPFRVHAQVAGVGAHIASDKTGRFEGGEVGVFDGGDIGGLDLQLALNVKQRFAQRGAFASHEVAEAQVKVVKALRLVLYGCRRF